jgi:hypothetical protein
MSNVIVQDLVSSTFAAAPSRQARAGMPRVGRRTRGKSHIERLTPPLETPTVRRFYRHAKSQAPKAASPCFDSDFRRYFYRQAGNWCDGKFSASSWPQIFTVRFTVKVESIPFYRMDGC